MSTDQENRNNHESALMARLDERTIAIQEALGTIKENMKAIELQIENTSRDGESGRNKILETIDKTYVKQTEFFPIKLLVYGFAGLVLTAFVTALIVTTLRQPVVSNYNIDQFPKGTNNPATPPK